MAKSESHGLTASPSKDSPSDRVRDGRKTTQDDGSRATNKESPDHGTHLSHGLGRFLWEVDPTTLPEEGWIDELVRRHERWEETGEANTADLTGWSDE